MHIRSALIRHIHRSSVRTIILILNVTHCFSRKTVFRLRNVGEVMVRAYITILHDLFFETDIDRHVFISKHH